MRKALCVGALTAALLLSLAPSATAVPASEEAPAHAAVVTDVNGALAATRPGYSIAYVNAVPRSNAKQPVTQVQRGFVVARLPVYRKTQGQLLINGSDASGNPNSIIVKAYGRRVISLGTAGYVTLEGRGFDAASTVSLFVILNANPLQASLIANVPVAATGAIASTTLPLPTGVFAGNVTIQVVGAQGGRTTAVSIGARASSMG